VLRLCMGADGGANHFSPHGSLREDQGVQRYGTAMSGSARMHSSVPHTMTMEYKMLL
jgi:hypothetical protein